MSMRGAWYALRSERGREELRFLCGSFTKGSSPRRLGVGDLGGGADEGSCANGGLGSARGSAVGGLLLAVAGGCVCGRGCDDCFLTLAGLGSGAGTESRSRWPRMKERTGEEARWPTGQRMARGILKWVTGRMIGQ